MSRAPTCPICRKPASEDYRPFCSRRCADIDLGRWLSGAYAIPAHDPAQGEEAPGNMPENAPGDRDETDR